MIYKLLNITECERLQNDVITRLSSAVFYLKGGDIGSAIIVLNQTDDKVQQLRDLMMPYVVEQKGRG